MHCCRGRQRSVGFQGAFVPVSHHSQRIETQRVRDVLGFGHQRYPEVLVECTELAVVRKFLCESVDADALRIA